MTKHPKFVVYQGSDRQWRWRLVAGNGRIVAQNEGFPTRAHAERAVDAVQRAASTAHCWVIDPL